jgi:hypothetical protein
MAGESPPRGLSGRESPAPALSETESPAPALSQWLQLMLAEMAARREALERARAEEVRRRAERAAESADSRGGAPLS